jgi:hypothetical protein
MESVEKQEICVKFCFKAETVTCCVKLMAMMPRVKRQPTNGSNVLKMEELQWMMMSGLADLKPQEPNL